MGKPLMIQLEDDEKIVSLKKLTGAKTKIDVVRMALDLLESDVNRSERVKRWQKAVKIIGLTGLVTLKDFQTKRRFDKIP